MPNEQPYFTVKVTRCGECPHLSDEFDVCGKEPVSWRREDRYHENTKGITPSCPMWAQRVQEEKVSGWQPISTAPKDGTHILSHKPDSDTCYVIAWADFRKGIRAEYGSAYVGWHLAWDGTFFHPYEAPTHWQPLPEPPKD